MAKVTKEMEFDELAKKAQFFLCTSNWDGIVIVVDDRTESILWRKDFGSDYKHTARRWQEIKWTHPRNEDQEPRPYFTIYGTRYYLDNFMRCA